MRRSPFARLACFSSESLAFLIRFPDTYAGSEQRNKGNYRERERSGNFISISQFLDLTPKSKNSASTTTAMAEDLTVEEKKLLKNLTVSLFILQKRIEEAKI